MKHYQKLVALRDAREAGCEPEALSWFVFWLIHSPVIFAASYMVGYLMIK